MGSLDISGNYSQAGFLDIDLDGPDSVSVLNAGGEASLGGTLDVSLLGGFVPTPSETFLVMTYGSVSGSFYDIADSGLRAGEFWRATYDPNDLYLTVDTGSPSAPEPASVVLLALGLGALRCWSQSIRLTAGRSAKRNS